MGNSISRSANQTAHEEQPNTHSTTNTNRIQFSASLSSLSNFTSKYLFRARKSYSLSTIDPIAKEHQPPKASRQVIRRRIFISFCIWNIENFSKSNEWLKDFELVFQALKNGWLFDFHFVFVSSFSFDSMHTRMCACVCVCVLKKTTTQR